MMSPQKDRDYLSKKFPVTYEHKAIDSSVLLPYARDYDRETLLSLFGFYSIRAGDDIEWVLEKDSHTKYRVNKYGYRDPEYSTGHDLLAAGCSQTWGQGVPENYRWSTKLGQKLGMTTATIAVPGWSAQSIISAVMFHIKKYGKPKAVALYLPDFFRFDMIENTETLVDSKPEPGEYTDRLSIKVGHSMTAGHVGKLSKRPHITEEVVNPEFSYLLNGQTLRFFIEYCKEADIQLVWSTWNGSVKEIVEYLDEAAAGIEDTSYFSPSYDLSNYVNIDFVHDGEESIDDLSTRSCHLKLKGSIPAGDAIYYDKGIDTDVHMGLHAHAHVAEHFYEALTNGNS